MVSKEETVERVLGMLRARMTQRRVLLPIFREMDEDKSGAPAGTKVPPALSEASGLRVRRPGGSKGARPRPPTPQRGLSSLRA